MRNPYMKFQNPSMHGSYDMACIKKHRTDTHTRMENPKAICPPNFFQSLGDKNRWRSIDVTYMPIFYCSFLRRVAQATSTSSFNIWVDDVAFYIAFCYNYVCLIGLWFYGPVNAIKGMLNQSVNYLKLFLGRAVNHYKVHILSTVTDNCPTWNSSRERVTEEIISRLISKKDM